ncbi:MAG: GNAT family N-acetyltransferase [Acidimicrobiales bacterium]
MAIEVDAARVADDELLAALNRLLPQLSSNARALSVDGLSAIVESSTTTLFVARDEGEIVGVATLVVFSIPTGLRAWVEDVVVDESARGRGVGESLTAAMIAAARAAGARTLDLTSHRSREAAHALYERMGFSVRDSSLYRLGLD